MWNPDVYLTYADHRGRPFYDLLSRVGAREPRRIVDLGCGPGNLTETLTERWPGAVVEAWDSSPEMVEAARNRGLDARVGDVRDWTPAPDTDILVSNAARQQQAGGIECAVAHGGLQQRLAARQALDQHDEGSRAEAAAARLALALDAQGGLREDLRILVMSATLDGARAIAIQYWPDYAELVAQMQRRELMLPIVAFRRFCTGWENVSAPYQRGLGGFVADASLKGLDPLQMRVAGIEAYNLLYLDPSAEKNSAAPSPSSDSPPTSGSGAPSAPDGKSAATDGQKTPPSSSPETSASP